MKEFLYVGYYFDKNNNFVLKIGTTNNLARRKREHNQKYLMREGCSFEYIWHLPLSKYNTLRYEDKNKELWQQMGIGEYVRNDRFIMTTPLDCVQVQIRKTYTISLKEFFNA